MVFSLMKIYQLKSSSLHLYRSFLRRSPRDTEIWQYAKDKKLVIVTKDTDFSNQLMLNFFAPKVVHLRFGNIRKREFHQFLAPIWPEVEALVIEHKLVNVYLDRIEAFR
ncbi:DUF5615 family PIN-like protein [Microcystis aeruginosa FACHB-524]|uniref:DUF5615 family PIN-like protein n=1 Tax=Microcystis aeruginosa TaxID=1126 RepID=UPI003B28D604